MCVMSKDPLCDCFRMTDCSHWKFHSQWQCQGGNNWSEGFMVRKLDEPKRCHWPLFFGDRIILQNVQILWLRKRKIDIPINRTVSFQRFVFQLSEYKIVCILSKIKSPRQLYEILILNKIYIRWKGLCCLLKL